MQITLVQFEQIDSLMGEILRMGEFETCPDPRGYIRTSNRLFDALVDALGYAEANSWPSALECAADLVSRALLGVVEVLDEAADTEATGE